MNHSEKQFTYCPTPDRGGSGTWALAGSRYQLEDLELIPWDVVRQGQVRFGLQWGRFRSWLCFGFDDSLLVEGGVLKTSYRRWVDADGGARTDSWPRGVHSIPSQH